VLKIWGSRGGGAGQFHEPNGIALDMRGNIYVADMLNGRVVKLSPAGAVLAIWR
jgi:DNA-binding beta-propeller fold protein YncE